MTVTVLTMMRNGLNLTVVRGNAMGKYSIIYVDPPWHYRTYSQKGQSRSAERHYPTMRIEQIKALPVEKLAADDCALFMWITFPCMKEAFEVLEAWDFQYKTVTFVWVKQNRISDGLFWAWVIGLAPMQRSVFWQRKDTPSGCPPVCTRSL